MTIRCSICRRPIEFPTRIYDAEGKGMYAPCYRCIRERVRDDSSFGTGNDAPVQKPTKVDEAGAHIDAHDDVFRVAWGLE